MTTAQLVPDSGEWVPEIRFGDRLRAVRRGRHRSQQQMADLLGVKKVTLASWEAGIASPPYAEVMKLAKRLFSIDGVPQWWTLGAEDPAILRDIYERARQDSNLQPSDPKVDGHFLRPRRDRRRRRDWQRIAAPVRLSVVRCEDEDAA